MYSVNINTGKAESQVVVGVSYRNLDDYLPHDRQIIAIADANILK